MRNPKDSRERLSLLVTSPRNGRFARVIVNRLWHRLLGTGIVDPVDDWVDNKPSHPELLDYLALELMANGYDLKHVARLILNSQTYQRSVDPDVASQPNALALFATPVRRRMSAEQLVDSLFQVAGKGFGCEELNLDINGRRTLTNSLNLAFPIAPGSSRRSRMSGIVRA